MRVSVIIPTYNRAAFISQAVNSVISQCRDEDEVIVVDDGSDDDTEARLAPFRSRIVYRKIANGGAGRARNIGLSVAKNPLIAFLDSDDEWLPGKLEIQRALMAARPDILFCFSNLTFRYSSDCQQKRTAPPAFSDVLGPGLPFSSIAPLPEGRSDWNVHIGDLYAKQMEKEYVSLCTLIFRRHEALTSLRFPEDLPTREDWEFVGRLARRGLAAHLDGETVIANLHGGPQLTKLDSLLFIDARLKLLERVWGSDAAFMDKYGSRYHEVLYELRLRRIQKLLARGRAGEARIELKRTKHVPFRYRILCHAPGRTTEVVLKAGRYFGEKTGRK